MSAPLRDHLRLHWVVFLWSLTAIFGSLLSLHPLATVTCRTFIAALAIAVLVLLADRRGLAIDRRGRRRLLAIGFLIGIHWSLFFASVTLANASVCLVGISTTTLWTALLEPWFVRRRTRWFEVALGSVVLLGIGVIYLSDFQFQLGLSLALGAALFAALFGILNGTTGRRYEPAVTTFYEMTGACALCAFLALVAAAWSGFSGQATLRYVPSGWEWLWLMLLALVCTTYAYVTYVDLLKVFSVFVISLVANLEPVYGIVLAALALGEHEQLSPQFYFGAIIVIAAIAAHPLFSSRQYRPGNRKRA